MTPPPPKSWEGVFNSRLWETTPRTTNQRTSTTLLKSRVWIILVWSAFKRAAAVSDISDLKRPPRCDPVWAGLTWSHLVWLSLGQPGVSLVPVPTLTWVTWASSQSVVVMQSARSAVLVVCWDDFSSQANCSKEEGLMFRSNQWQPEVLADTALWLFYFVNCRVSSLALTEFQWLFMGLFSLQKTSI